MSDEQLTELYATMRALWERLGALEYVRADQCKAGDTVLYYSWTKRITKVTKNTVHVVNLLTKTKQEWLVDVHIFLVRVITPEDAQYIVDNAQAWYLYGNSVDVDEFISLWNQRQEATPC